MQKFKSVDELVRHLRPVKPVYCIRKESVSRASIFFQKNFPGKVLYAVKTNPHKAILKKLLESGLKSKIFLNEFLVLLKPHILKTQKLPNI